MILRWGLAALAALGGLPPLRAQDQAGAPCEAAFAQRLTDLGLDKLAYNRLKKPPDGSAPLDPAARGNLRTILGRVCGNLAAQSGSSEERKKYLKEATEITSAMAKEHAGADTPAQRLELALLFFQQGESLFQDSRQEPASDKAAKEARDSLSEAGRLLDELLKAREEELERIEQGLGNREPESSPTWRQVANMAGRVRYFRAWTAYYHGRLESGPAQQEKLKRALEDFGPFVEPFDEDGKLGHWIFKSVIGTALTNHALGKVKEAHDRLQKLKDKLLTDVQKTEVLLVEKQFMETENRPEDKYRLLFDYVENLHDPEKPTGRDLLIKAELLKLCLELFKKTGAPKYRNTGIRHAEDFVALPEPYRSTGFQAITTFALGGDSRLSNVTKAEESFEKGEFAKAALLYRKALQSSNLPDDLARLVRVKLAYSLAKSKQETEALAELDRVLEERNKLDATLRPLAVRLRAGLREKLWEEAGGKEDSLFEAYRQVLQSLLGEKDEDVGRLCLRGAFAYEALSRFDAAREMCAKAGKDPACAADVRLLLSVLRLRESGAQGLDAAAREVAGALRSDAGAHSTAFVRGHAKLALARVWSKQEGQARPIRDLLLGFEEETADQPEMVRRARIYRLVARLDLDDWLAGQPDLAALVAEKPAADAWEANAFVRGAQAFEKAATGGPRAQQWAGLALSAYAAALTWFEKQHDEARQKALRFPMAELALKAGKPEQAKALYDAVSADEQKTFEWRKGKALSLESAGQPREALEIWRVLTDELPKGHALWLEAKYHLARCLLETGDTAHAMRVIQFTRELHPDLGGTALRQAFQLLELRCQEAVKAK